MSDIKNAGGKGYCFAYFLVFFVMLISLILWIYFSNRHLDF